LTEHPNITRVRLYRDHGKEFRFEAVAANGLTIASSSEGYENRKDALAAAVSLFPGALIVDETQAASD